ncbi:Guanine-nucleotide dissociation stimulator CDC25 [Penicillium vulpinum]|uniref:Guanine-nucleotide dissociation stimulator CDC25 n=1 Tax=Penicillium vulpinum TaxID=29845 RepID=UPI002548383E|nr:Guanine-nucleotide dissociation stimulator CDC25 [Penicillium vulpinum]KAJ5952708.1 Guanine-nucleotide dissociation stimulator CDC25 [Penicillium vulpinum]
MFEIRAADLAVNTTALAKSGTVATAFEYTDEQVTTPTAVSRYRGRGNSLSRNYNHINHSPVKMASGYPVSPEPPALFVRAMYDYDADDHTSLSFRRGDIIQVLNQLETGWWDGVIDDVRGWFPSNYCTPITEADDVSDHFAHAHHETDLSADSGLEDEYGDGHDDDEVNSEGNSRDSYPIHSTEGIQAPKEQEEAAFWIPQATPDGRLFYFNTLTGYSTMELPFENPTAATEPGPRDRNNFFVPDQTRPPPELMARGFERDEDEYDGSASEAEGESLMLGSHDSISRRRPSVLDGVSPATSMDSLYAPGSKEFKTPQPPNKSAQKTYSLGGNSTSTSVNESFSRPSISSNPPQHFVDDGFAPPITWPLLVDNMRYAVEAYRQTLFNGERAEYVRKAEDISDHLRMLLAAGSDTTDNHSGNPSIISTNKALYPYFRDMMSKFSKLVLSSHIAAADWPGADSANKCLQEADGVMQGVYGYVEVAQQQRGDTIHRIVPGFVSGSSSGGSWQNNGVSLNASGPTSFLVPDGGNSRVEPSVSLDTAFLDSIDILRRSFVGSIRRLEELLVINRNIVTAKEHQDIADAISAAAIKVIEQFRPWISSVESMNLAPLGTSFQNPQLVDFSLQKQRVYDAIGDFVLSCQAVSAPLADEWAELRGNSLDDRVNAVRGIARQLENYVSQIGFSLSLLLEQIPTESALSLRRDSRQEAEDESYKNIHNRGDSKAKIATESIGIPSSYAPEKEGTNKVRRNMDKAQRFFGQAPPTAITREPIREPVREPEETPWFLKMAHEGEVFYDNKGDLPILKCGTLAGLVEHLTRHDKLDASFNNTFLLTYRSFTTATELFEMLVQRFNIQPPFGLNQDDMQMWIDRKQKPIRFRVVNILKSWFDHFWMEPNDEKHMDLLRRVHNFTSDSIATTKTPGTPTLLAVIEQRLRGQDTTVKRLVPTQSTAAPTPIIPKNMKKLKFLDIDPTEFARQLTIIESRLYSKIRPTECLNKTWQKKVGPDEPEPSPHVKALILHSNQLTNWVAEMILTQGDVKKRVVVIKHFVNVADKCRNLNNYSTLTSIISALGTAPIHRLGRTWGQVSGRTSAILEQMRRLMASTKNFGEYRETLHLANPPCIPFFGVYLTDLTFIEDGIPSLTPSELINFNKRAKTAEVIRDIQQYQNVPYLLQPVGELQDYILSNLQGAGDVHDMYERSLEIEPREREDEKIARYAEATSRDKSSLLFASTVAILR